MVAESILPVKPDEHGDEPTIAFPRLFSSGKTMPRCPNCQKSYFPGELACSYCGVLFTSGATTKKLGGAENVISQHAIPEEIDTNQKPILFDINGKQLRLPIAKSLVIGRMSEFPGDVRPDVSLNAFGAAVHGVSRQHSRIMRKRDLVYVADLDSSNGTFLNGRRLTRNSYRILNSGDELQLGSLKLTVRF